MEPSRPPKEKQERYERVVVSPEPLDHLKKFCRVLQPTEQESWKDYTVFKTVSWLGPGAPMEAPDGWLVLGSSPEEALILPERTIDWFTHNRKTLDVVCGVIEAMNANQLPDNEALEALEKPLRRSQAFQKPCHARRCIVHRRGGSHQRRIVGYGQATQADVNQQVESAMNDAKMALSGAELLEALADGTAFQRKLRDATGHVIQEAMQQAREQLAAFLEPARLRCPFDIFTDSWPAKSTANRLTASMLRLNPSSKRSKQTIL